jgi:hypothetical protein
VYERAIINLLKGKANGCSRLHPPRPDGSGISEGCITFFLPQDFYRVRAALLKAHRHRILQGDQFWAYGEITVIGHTQEDCRVTPD